MNTDLLIIGAGAGGISSAYAATEYGVKNVVILEKGESFGGILNQCIHSGFGSIIFKEELTGPEYASHLFNMLNFSYTKIFFYTTVLDIDLKNRSVYAVNTKFGTFRIGFKALVIATGCYELPLGNLIIPGSRPAGIMSAGAAQKIVNRYGYLPGKSVAIFGSNIVGLTVARRLAQEGAKVHCVVEPFPYCRGPLRDEYLCRTDYTIPIFYSKNISRIIGKKRIKGIEVSETASGSKKFNYIELDTLLYAIDLVPENSLFCCNDSLKLDSLTNGPIVDQYMQTSIPGIYACGNNVYIHNIVDFVTKDALKLGYSVAKFIKKFPHSFLEKGKIVYLKPGDNIKFIVPQRLTINQDSDKLIEIFVKVKKPLGKVVFSFEFSDKKIVKKIRTNVVPSNVEKFTLLMKDFENTDSDNLCVSLSECL